LVRVFFELSVLKIATYKIISMPKAKKKKTRKPTLKTKLTKDLRKEVRTTRQKLRQLERDLKSLSCKRRRQ